MINLKNGALGEKKKEKTRSDGGVDEGQSVRH